MRGWLGAGGLPSGFWLVTLVCGPGLALIWFPEQIDDFTYGAWYRGYQVDSHTPSLATLSGHVQRSTHDLPPRPSQVPRPA